MSQLDAIIENYEKLIAYCDQFFNAVYEKHSDNMQCKKGCAGCCILQSILPIEAYYLSQHITQHNIKQQENNGPYCVFLDKSACTVYQARPLICRTHGLLLFNKNDNTLESSCNLNFRDGFDGLEKSAFDQETISDNLVRLNLAFLMTIGEDTETGRISLQDLPIN